MVDDPSTMVGDVSPWSVMLHRVHTVFVGTCAIFRRAEQGKQRQLVHGDGYPSKPEHACGGPSSRGYLIAFLA